METGGHGLEAAFHIQSSYNLTHGKNKREKLYVGLVNLDSIDAPQRWM